MKLRFEIQNDRGETFDGPFRHKSEANAELAKYPKYALRIVEIWTDPLPDTGWIKAGRKSGQKALGRL